MFAPIFVIEPPKIDDVADWTFAVSPSVLGSEGVPCSCTPHKRSVAFARCLIVVSQGPQQASVPPPTALIGGPPAPAIPKTPSLEA